MSSSSGNRGSLWHRTRWSRGNVCERVGNRESRCWQLSNKKSWMERISTESKSRQRCTCLRRHRISRSSAVTGNEPTSTAAYWTGLWRLADGAQHGQGAAQERLRGRLRDGGCSDRCLPRRDVAAQPRARRAVVQRKNTPHRRLVLPTSQQEANDEADHQQPRRPGPKARRGPRRRRSSGRGKSCSLAFAQTSAPNSQWLRVGRKQ